MRNVVLYVTYIGFRRSQSARRPEHQPSPPRPRHRQQPPPLSRLRRHSFDAGLSLLASYAWSKSIDSTPGVATSDEAGSAFAQDARNLAAESGVFTFHTPHRLDLSAVYTLPFDKAVGNSRFLRPVLSGWQTTGISPPWPTDPSPSPPAATKATPTAVPIVPTRSLIDASRNNPRQWNPPQLSG